MNDAPVVGRLRRPGWRDPRLVVGLFLVAVSVAAVTNIVARADLTTAHFAARETITPGTVLEESDFVLVNVKVGQGLYVEASGQPWGQVTTRVIGQGELIPVEALVSPEEADGRPVPVQTSLPLAEGIVAGSTVDVYVTYLDDLEGSVTEAVAKGLTVQSVETPSGGFSSTSQQTVYVTVPEDEVADFLTAIAVDGDISVVGLGG